MKSLKYINKFIIQAGIAVIPLLLAAAGYGQISIGTLKLPEVKIPVAKDGKPATNSGSDQTGANNQTEPPAVSANSEKDDEIARWLDNFISDIRQAKEEIDVYTPEGRMYLVQSPLQKWLLYAVSPKAKGEFAKDKKITEWLKANPGNKFEAALAELSVSAAKKLPDYIPNNNNFAFKDAATEQMMKAKLKNSASLKIIKIGLSHSIWKIEKNDLGLPTNRYREGYIWAKDSADDYSYCHLYGFVVQQDYAGGGSYGQTYAYLNTDALFGCPAK